jgi:hypothetical protein
MSERRFTAGPFRAFDRKVSTPLLRRETAAQAEDRIVEQAPEFIPNCVIGIAAYWRRKGPRQIAISPKHELD